MQESPVVLTIDGSVVYCNTNRGVVAALRIRDGQLRWLVPYRREVASRAGSSSGNSAGAKYRWPNACLFHQGLLLVAPTDSRELLALDAASGARIWSRRVPLPAVKMLGTMGDKLILVGDRLWAIDIVFGGVGGWMGSQDGRLGSTARDGGGRRDCRAGDLLALGWEDLGPRRGDRMAHGPEICLR